MSQEIILIQDGKLNADFLIEQLESLYHLVIDKRNDIMIEEKEFIRNEFVEEIAEYCENTDMIHIANVLPMVFHVIVCSSMYNREIAYEFLKRYKHSDDINDQIFKQSKYIQLHMKHLYLSLHPNDIRYDPLNHRMIVRGDPSFADNSEPATKDMIYTIVQQIRATHIAMFEQMINSVRELEERAETRTPQNIFELLINSKEDPDYLDTDYVDTIDDVKVEEQPDNKENVEDVKADLDEDAAEVEVDEDSVENVTKDATEVETVEVAVVEDATEDAADEDAVENAVEDVAEVEDAVKVEVDFVEVEEVKVASTTEVVDE